MSKALDPSLFYTLPSGARVHPSRLIVRDGHYTWSSALLDLPSERAHEAHIVKTAARLEELASELGLASDDYPLIYPVRWYEPGDEEFGEGIAVLLGVRFRCPTAVFIELGRIVAAHEQLEQRGRQIFFRRC